MVRTRPGIWAVSVLSAATLVAGTLVAQEPPATSHTPNVAASANNSAGRIGNTESQIESLSKQLGLTDSQKQKIRPLLAHETERIREVLSNGSLTQREARRRVAMIRSDTRARIAEVLSPKQKPQWEAASAEHRADEGPQSKTQAMEKFGDRQNPPNLN